MINDNKVEQIKSQLLSQPENQLYAVIDGASCPQLRFKLHDLRQEGHNLQSCCLWSGKLAPDLEEVAPYMVKLQQDCPFTDWLIREGWDNHWNIFVTSALEFKAARKQIRHLLQARSLEGETLIFRFYDPRVMAAYAPTCDAEQAQMLYQDLVSISYQQGSELIASCFSEVSQAVECKVLV